MWNEIIELVKNKFSKEEEELDLIQEVCNLLGVIPEEPFEINEHNAIIMRITYSGLGEYNFKEHTDKRAWTTDAYLLPKLLKRIFTVKKEMR